MDTRDRQAALPRIAADTALGVALAAAIAITALAIADTWGGNYWMFGSATGLVMAALALMRRHHRGWPAVAGLAVATTATVTAELAHLPTEPGPASALGLSVLIGSAIRTLPTPWATAITTGGLALVAGTTLTESASTVTMLGIAGWLGALSTGLGLRLLDTHHHTASEQARHDERLELARELHDIVAHHITGVVLHAQAARVVRRKHPEQLDDYLAGIETAGSDALAAMRRVVGLLRDTNDASPATTGPEQLSELVARFTNHGHTVHHHLPDNDQAWPPEVTSTVYRVVQESLTNITKHAQQANTVTVNVTQNSETITVKVEDDAPPTPPLYPRRSGYGLVGMRERIKAIGGTLSAGPRHNTGWSVHAELPLQIQERR